VKQLAGFLLILALAAGADGLMEMLGLFPFVAIATVVVVVAGALITWKD
jgi:hypothetical protein